MKKLIFLLLFTFVLCSCNSKSQPGNTTVQIDEIMPAETTVAETTDDTAHLDNLYEIKERGAKMIVDQIIHHVMDLDEWAASDYECSSLDMFRFISTLNLYRDDNAHPYSNMVSLSDDETFFEISKEDGDLINARLFRVNDWENSSYYKEMFDEDKECYCTPYGIGVWTTPYTYKNMEAHSDDNFIFVEVELISSDKFEYEYKEYVEYVFVFANEDLTLLDFRNATANVFVTP